MTHDHPVCSLNVLDGIVIGNSMQRHRNQEFIRFLNAIDTELPAGKRHPQQLRRSPAPQVSALARPPSALHLPRYRPTSCSWLDAV